MLITEIQKLVQQHLPEATAGELKKFIQEAEFVKEELKEVKQQLQEITTDRDYQKQQFMELYQQRAKWFALEDKEQELKKREEAIEKTILEIQLKSSQESLSKVYNLVEIVFKNPRLTYSESSNVPYRDQYGNSCTLNGSKFTTVEESK